jgi:hypothetical protein
VSDAKRKVPQDGNTKKRKVKHGKVYQGVCFYLCVQASQRQEKPSLELKITSTPKEIKVKVLQSRCKRQ